MISPHHPSHHCYKLTTHFTTVMYNLTTPLTTTKTPPPISPLLLPHHPSHHHHINHSDHSHILTTRTTADCTTSPTTSSPLGPPYPDCTLAPPPPHHSHLNLLTPRTTISSPLTPTPPPNHKMSHPANLPTIEAKIPAPPPITLPGPDQKSMTDYVKAFAPQHGYLISIGRSWRGKGLSQYRCHRSGLPESSKDPTKLSKSLKIDCPFKLKAQFSSSKNTWTLSHININHNHEPNFDIQPPDLEPTTLDPDVESFLTAFGPRIRCLPMQDQKSIILQINQSLSNIDTIKLLPETSGHLNQNVNPLTFLFDPQCSVLNVSRMHGFVA